MPKVYDDADTDLDELEKSFHAPSAETSGSDIARQREIDGLNKHFADSPDETPESPSKIEDASSLKDKEETPDDTVGEGYTGDKSSSASRVRKRLMGSKKGAAILGSGALALGVGSFFAFMSLGPLQLIHYANILRNPIRISENASTQRLGHFLLAQRSVGKGGVGQNVVARTRVNAVEYKMVKTVNARMAKIGVTYQFNDFGRVSGISIDISKHPDYKSLSDQAARAKLADTLGVSPDKIDMPKRGGVIMKADISKLPIKVQRSFFKGQIKTLGEGKIVTALNVRIIGKYLRLPGNWLHPWEKAKARGTQTIGNAILNTDSYKKFKAWEEERLKAKTARSAAAKAKFAEVRGKFSAKAGVGGVILGGQTILCTIRDASSKIPDANRAAFIEPAVASAGDATAIGSQVESGDDFEDAMVSATLANWTDKDGKTPFHSAGIHNLEGKSGGTPIDEATAKAFDPDNTAASITKVLDEKLQADKICSGIGQLTGAMVGITLLLSGPGGWAIKAGSTVVGAATGMAAIALVMKSVEHFLVDEPEAMIAHLGTKGGNIDALGAIELANITSRASGGVRLSNQSTALLQQEVFDDQLHEFQQKSFIARLASPKDYRSLTGQIVNEAPITANQQVASVTRTLSDAPKLALMGFANFFGGKKAKAAPMTPLIPYYGMPAGTLDKPELSDPYDLGNHVADLLDGSKGDDLREHALQCWGNKISKEGDTWDVKKERDVNPASEDFQEAHCDDWSADVQAISTWIGYVHDADGYLCANATKEDTADSCDRVGVNSAASSTTGGEQPPASFNQDDLLKDSTGLNCPTGTEDLGEEGIQEGWTGGKMVKIKVCGIPGMKNVGGSHIPKDNGNIVVNVRIAANWLALFNKAKADGITLAAVSGFRTYAQQEALCPCDGVSVAKPGTSNHQMGLAIDIAGTKIMGSDSSSCKLRAIDPSSKIWTWLNNNAAAQGLRQYTKESWHWDPDPTKSGNRCGGDGSMRT